MALLDARIEKEDFFFGWIEKEDGDPVFIQTIYIYTHTHMNWSFLGSFVCFSFSKMPVKYVLSHFTSMCNVILILVLVYVGFIILASKHAFHLLLGWSKQCLLPPVMAPLLVGICATWIGVCWGPPYLSVILVGGFMDVSIGRRSVLYQFTVVTVFMWTYEALSWPSYIWYEFWCRTLIRHVSSLDGWTRTHAIVVVQQHQMCGKILWG